MGKDSDTAQLGTLMKGPLHAPKGPDVLPCMHSSGSIRPQLNTCILLQNKHRTESTLPLLRLVLGQLTRTEKYLGHPSTGTPAYCGDAAMSAAKARAHNGGAATRCKRVGGTHTTKFLPTSDALILLIFLFSAECQTC